MSMSIPDLMRFENYKRLLAQWPGVCQRVRALEEAAGLPEPPCERYRRQPRSGVVPGMSMVDFDNFEALREMNSEFPWVRARLIALEAALKSDADA